MTRTDVRRRALRAAMAVTLGTAMLGCGTTVTGSKGQGEGGSASANGGASAASTGAIASTSTSTAGGADSGTGGDSGSGGAAQASTSGSGGAPAAKCDRTTMDSDAYVKCCDSVNWDLNQGCEAWGPPMPPSMDWRPEEVA